MNKLHLEYPKTYSRFRIYTKLYIIAMVAFDALLLSGSASASLWVAGLFAFGGIIAAIIIVCDINQYVLANDSGLAIISFGKVRKIQWNSITKMNMHSSIYGSIRKYGTIRLTMHDGRVVQLMNLKNASEIESKWFEVTQPFKWKALADAYKTTAGAISDGVREMCNERCMCGEECKFCIEKDGETVCYLDSISQTRKVFPLNKK